ncbi:vomeronasal type-2 receptor 26-like [Hyla sarda]|uniref:vomeronasal type-2 receptor 26-like n=1 Tax=Hyla sarda TaxID=327740 RepID=UPI0024C225DF|nr:vomeronasal type-2 receptor 26-like [Hyla sarda]
MPFEEATRFVSENTGISDVLLPIFHLEQTFTVIIEEGGIEEGSHLDKEPSQVTVKMMMTNLGNASYTVGFAAIWENHWLANTLPTEVFQLPGFSANSALFELYPTVAAASVGVISGTRRQLCLCQIMRLQLTYYSRVPVSCCSDPCLPGSRKKAGKSIYTCFYDCVPCSEGEISNITDSENCMKCPSDEWPNEKRDRCLPKVIDFISYQNDTMASVFSCVSIFGCLVTGFIFGIFISYRDTPIVKANNRNLSYLLLVSILLSFLSVFLFLGRPSDVSCRLRETSFGVFFSVAVSSLLVKTVMVCVAFKSTKPGSPWRKWLSVKLPYTIVLLCSSIQVVICVIWLSISPPFQDLDTQSYLGKIIIQCNTGSDIWFYSVLGYLGFLAAVSFVLAFMVRTLPDTFNEAKYITFSMLLFCSVWIAMIPAYLSTTGKSMVAVEIFAVMASSAGLLGCGFFPKCFIILLKSEMNRKTDLLGKRKK